MTRLLTSASIAVALTLSGGCAARLPRTGVAGTPASSEGLSEYIAKVRHLSAAAHPAAATETVATLEDRDPAIAAELLAVAAVPTADRHRRLGDLYRERGVLDAAYRHFNRAIVINPRDAGAYEGLARVWRDWGLPQLGLADAYRATYFAPQSAAAHNTYGTLRQALGDYSAARNAYELASWLDPTAAYAVNNLCYLSFLGGRTDAAIETCTRALKLDPSLTAARHNLALAFAAAGRMDVARTQFLDAGDRASALYNLGIVHLSRGEAEQALASFDAASRERATFALARERARQIREQQRVAASARRLDAAPTTRDSADAPRQP